MYDFNKIGYSPSLNNSPALRCFWLYRISVFGKFGRLRESRVLFSVSVIRLKTRSSYFFQVHRWCTDDFGHFYMRFSKKYEGFQNNLHLQIKYRGSPNYACFTTEDPDFGSCTQKWGIFGLSGDPLHHYSPANANFA